MADEPQSQQEVKRKRNDLSYEKKLEIVEALKNCDKKYAVSTIAKEYGLNRRHIQKLRENESTIREAAQALGEGRKRRRKTKESAKATSTTSCSQNSHTDSASGISVVVIDNESEDAVAEQLPHESQNSDVLAKDIVEIIDEAAVCVGHEATSKNQHFDTFKSETLTDTQKYADGDMLLPETVVLLNVGQTHFSKDKSETDVPTKSAKEVTTPTPSLCPKEVPKESTAAHTKLDEQSEASQLPAMFPKLPTKESTTDALESRHSDQAYVVKLSPDTVATNPIKNEPMRSCNHSSQNQSCDSCVLLKFSVVGESVKYCVTCRQNLCSQHIQHHEGLYGQSHLMENPYKIKETLLLSERCVRHPGQCYSGGCELCLRMFCFNCLSAGQGQGHKTASANELAMKIKDSLTKRLLFMENMRAGIQATMDDVTKQVRDIREYKIRQLSIRFDELEQQFLTKIKSDNVLENMESYIQTLERTISEATEREGNTCSQLQLSGLVRLVNHFKESSAEMKKFHDLPEKKYEAQISATDQYYGGSINIAVELIQKLQVPKSIEPFKNPQSQLSTGGEGISWFQQYENITYFAFDKLIKMVDEQGVTHSLTTLPDKVADARINNETMFILTFRYIHKYSITGKFLMKWKVPSVRGKITVAGDNVVVASISGLSIYTRDGIFIRQQPINLKYLSVIGFAGLDETTILLLTHFTAGQAYMHRVDMTDGDVVWEDAGSISDAVYDGHRYIMALKHSAVFDGQGSIAALTNSELLIIDARTGRYVRNLKLPCIVANRYKQADNFTLKVKSVKMSISDDTLSIVVSYIDDDSSTNDDQEDDSDDDSIKRDDASSRFLHHMMKFTLMK